MKLDDDQLDQLLRDRLNRSLEAQLGRAEAALEEALKVQPPRRSWRMPLWFAGTLATAAAAVWAIAVIRPVSPPLSKPHNPVNPVPAVSVSQERQDVQFTAYQQTIDEGLRYLDEQTPVHQLRRQAIQQVQWVEPDGKTTMKVTVPTEQVLLVEYNKN